MTGGSKGSADLSVIRPRLAGRIHDELGVESLAELETAAYDGRLAGVEGLGRRRIQMITESLAGRLRRPERSLSQ